MSIRHFLSCFCFFFGSQSLQNKNWTACRFFQNICKVYNALQLSGATFILSGRISGSFWCWILWFSVPGRNNFIYCWPLMVSWSLLLAGRWVRSIPVCLKALQSSPSPLCHTSIWTKLLAWLSRSYLLDFTLVFAVPFFRHLLQRPPHFSQLFW